MTNGVDEGLPLAPDCCCCCCCDPRPGTTRYKMEEELAVVGCGPPPDIDEILPCEEMDDPVALVVAVDNEGVERSTNG
jgi:hypothetical protein